MNNPYPEREPWLPRYQQQCGNCYYHVYFDAEITEGVEVTECRRRAPAPVLRNVGAYTTYFPEVDASEWCGEWAPQEVSA
jgi:hypothetical protein